jgi:hypothetical protein
MFRTPIRLTLALAFSVAVLSLSAVANTVISTFSSISPGYSTTSFIVVCEQNSCGGGTTGQDVAADFTPSSTVTFTELDIALRSGIPNTFTSFTIELVADSAGKPGSTVLDSWSVNSVPWSAAANNTSNLPSTPPTVLLPHSTIVLLAGTQYWVEAISTSTTEGGWDINNFSPVKLGNYDLMLLCSTAGCNQWSAQLNATPAYSVSGSLAAVPEPATVALLVGGLGLIAARRRRK